MVVLRVLYYCWGKRFIIKDVKEKSFKKENWYVRKYGDLLKRVFYG